MPAIATARAAYAAPGPAARAVAPATIAVAATFKPSAFNSQGVEPNASDPMFRTIGAYMAPNDAPPTKK